VAALNIKNKPDMVFIAGGLAINDGGKLKPALDAEVRLFKDKKLISMAATDYSGKFKFRNMQKNSGKYELEYVVEGYEPHKFEVILDNENLNLGTVGFK